MRTHIEMQVRAHTHTHPDRTSQYLDRLWYDRPALRAFRQTGLFSHALPPHIDTSLSLMQPTLLSSHTHTQMHKHAQLWDLHAHTEADSCTYTDWETDIGTFIQRHIFRHPHPHTLSLSVIHDWYYFFPCRSLSLSRVLCNLWFGGHIFPCLSELRTHTHSLSDHTHTLRSQKHTCGFVVGLHYQ